MPKEDPQGETEETREMQDAHWSPQNTDDEQAFECQDFPEGGASDVDDGQAGGGGGGGPYEVLSSQGPQESQGSANHPDDCQPCTFYCFTRRGCNRGFDCRYCHMGHQSKLQQRREAWKQLQREKRKTLRERAARDTPVQRVAPVQQKRPPAPGPVAPAPAASVSTGSMAGPKAIGRTQNQITRGSWAMAEQSPGIFKYTPESIVLTFGQHVQLVPQLAAMPSWFKLHGLLPAGLHLNAVTGVISGSATAPYGQQTVRIEAGTLDGQVAVASVSIEVIDFTKGGFVIGHISEFSPGRYMILMHVPDEEQLADSRGDSWGRPSDESQRCAMQASFAPYPPGRMDFYHHDRSQPADMGNASQSMLLGW